MDTPSLITLIICFAGLGWSAGPGVLEYWRGLRRRQVPFWLRYKPTGQVIYFPAHYEHDAIDALLKGLKELPKGVRFDSPDFERLSYNPAPGVSAAV